MTDFSGYAFDATGIKTGRAREYLATWQALEEIEVTVRAQRSVKFYHVYLGFAEGREISFAARPDILGRPRVEALAEVLQLASAGAPQSVQLSWRTRHVMEWGRVDAPTVLTLKRTSADDVDSVQLLQAAKWRWARLEYRRAVALARAAGRRSSLELEPRQILLRLAMERGASPHEMIGLAREVLVRDPVNREADAARVTALLEENRLGAQQAAETWLAGHGPEWELSLALARFHEAHQRWAEQAAVLQRLHAVTALSGRRATLAAAIQNVERLSADAGSRRRYQRKKRWRVLAPWVAAGAAVTVLIAGFASVYWHTNRTAKEFTRAQSEIDATSSSSVDFYERRLAKANAGDPSAMMTVAWYLEHGGAVAKDEPAAREWRMRAAKAGHVPAMMRVARSLQRGTAGEKDVAEAERWLERAAEAGDAEGASALGDLFSLGRDAPRDYARAYAWYERAAKLNHPHAVRRVGYMLELGQGVQKDAAKAVEHYLALAKNHDTWAQNRLGWMYARGIGVERDVAAALKYFRAAASAGEPNALTNLGLAYLHGHGLTRNDAEGLRLIRLAVAQKNGYAMLHLGMLYMRGVGVMKDEKRGADLVRQAAEGNYADARYLFAQFQRRGTGVPKDLVAARKSFERLNNRGYAPAKAWLAEFYISGSGGVATNFEKARELLMPVNEAEHPVGLMKLALLQWHGLGGRREPEQALKNFERAESRVPAALLFRAAALMTGDEASGIAANPRTAGQLLEAAAVAKDPLVQPYLNSVKEGADLNALLAGTVSMDATAPRVGVDDSEGPLPENRTPQVVYQVRPAYPFAMRYLEITGEVVVDFLVDAEGRVKQAYGLRSTHVAFEASAVAAVEKWRFKPGTKDGRAVTTHMQVPVIFTLDEEETAVGGGPAGGKRTGGTPPQ